MVGVDCQRITLRPRPGLRFTASSSRRRILLRIYIFKEGMLQVGSSINEEQFLRGFIDTPKD